MGLKHHFYLDSNTLAISVNKFDTLSLNVWCLIFKVDLLLSHYSASFNVWIYNIFSVATIKCNKSKVQLGVFLWILYDKYYLFFLNSKTIFSDLKKQSSKLDPIIFSADCMTVLVPPPS